MDAHAVVTCVPRNDGEVLLCRRSGDGRWTGVSGAVATDGDTDGERNRDPETAARAALAAETGLAGAATLVRAGEPFTAEESERRVRVHPFLFDCDSRAVEPSENVAETAWVHPPEILRRETVPTLWRSYDRVRPRVATVRDDRRHGSAWLSVRAVETLRDEAALAVAGRAEERETAERPSDDWDGLAALARQLRDARSSMAVLENRVNRTMLAASDDRTPEAVERAARGAVGQSVGADREAATVAAEELPERVATLSRSGTVERAIRAAAPAAVLVAESRPGGEGVQIAETLTEVADVTLTTDAALAFELAEFGAEAVVVGADRVRPDGSVVNKVGTRGAALAAAADGRDVFVVCASDKIARTADYDLEPRDAAALYDGTADLTVANPTFDVTPAEAVTAILTEQGALSTAAVGAIATAHREWAAWDD